MTVPVNTFGAFNAIGNREDLTDAIYNISPTDTPFISSVARVRATAVNHEWQIDELAAAAANAVIEGFDATADAATPTTRLGNICQIFRKVVSVSRTQRVVQSAGRRDEYAYQLAKRGKELKRDVELAFLSRNGKVAGTATISSGPREAGGLATYLYATTVVHKGSVTVTFIGNGTSVDQGDNVNGTVSPGTFKPLLDTVIGQLWTEGSDANVILCGRADKELISNITGIATLYREVPKGYQGAIIGGADLYVSNFGEFVVVPDRFIGANNIYLVDYEYCAVAELDPIQVAPLAKTGDSDRAMLVYECTLEVRNPRAHGGLFNLTAV